MKSTNQIVQNAIIATNLYKTPDGMHVKEQFGGEVFVDVEFDKHGSDPSVTFEIDDVKYEGESEGKRMLTKLRARVDYMQKAIAWVKKNYPKAR